VIVAVVGAAVLVPVFAETDADLPEITPAELATEIANAEPTALSGTLVHTADAGIPEIPGVTAGRSSGVGSKAGLLSSVLSGSTTVRIWYTDSEHVRLALQDDLVENDVIRNGDDLWVWSSAENSATQFDLGMLESLAMMGMDEDAMKPHDLSTPAALTDEMLEEFDHADFTVDGTTVVADRAAYEAVITPTDEGTLIDSIRIAVDGEKFEPLRVQVFSTSDGSDPSLEFGYTSVSFSEPDESVYEFSPPEGATVEEFNPLTWWLENSDQSSALDDALSTMPTVIGEGWASVLVVPNISLDDLMSVAPGEASEGLTELLMTQFTAVSGSYGAGVAYESDLFSVMLLDDGTLLVGAVTIETLEQAAAEA
jgi:hypothetical protein